MSFTKIKGGPNLYYIFFRNDWLILVLYVYYLFLTGVDKLIVGCKLDMTIEFEMKEITIIHYFLDLVVW